MPRKSTPTPSPRPTRPPRQRNASEASARPGLLNKIFKSLLLTGFVLGVFVLVSYLSYLDYNVRKQFEGKRWAIPAYVYANPLEVYAGYAISAEVFEQLLQQLRYRVDSQLIAEGSYFNDGHQIRVRTRSFDFSDQKQAGQALKFEFSGKSLKQIVNIETLQSVPVVRMDPIQIGSFYPSRKEDRVLIKLEQAPKTLIQGLLATEDRDYYDHYGISLRSIARALLANVRAGGLVQGGSTITQQLIKNFYLTAERTLWRKINEVLMAMILEYRYDKDEILEAYLNEIYLGQDGASAVHGFGLASEFYFGRPLQNLPLHEVAMLVALVRGPSYYDPRKQAERAIKRRNLVLEEMQAENYITAEESQAAQNMPLALIPYQHRSSNRYPAFMDLVKRQLIQQYHEGDLTSEGLKVFTNLDVQVQDALDQAIARKVPELEKRSRMNELQVAGLVTRRDNGEIVAIAGGSDPQDAGFNRALDAVRPIGSLIKPIVYLTALRYPNRYTITTPVSDTAITVRAQQGNPWTPHNYDRKEHGVVPLHKALAQSYNLATVRIGMDVGVARTAETLKNLGVTREVELFPSLLLGASELTPFEVTQMYQTLADDGFITPLRAIRAVINAEGKALQSYPYTVHQSEDPAAIYITNTIMQEVMRQGTAKSAYNVLPRDLDLAGKTGTTNEAKDSWFAGFSGDYLSVIWVGRDDNKPAGLSGATGALPIWTSLMKNIAKEPVNLIAPDNIRKVWIDPYSGLLANEDCPGSVLYPFINGSEPKEVSSCDTPDLPEDSSDSWLDDVINKFN